jgi:hypothetical protein
MIFGAKTSAYGSYVNSKLSRCTSNKNCWNALERPGVNQKPRPIVAHTNLDELNDYFISISDGAALDVLYAMNGIKSKAVGDDGFSVEFLKMIFEFVAEPITHLVNLSIRQWKFANIWKRNIAVSIPKKNVVLSLGDLCGQSVSYQWCQRSCRS